MTRLSQIPEVLEARGIGDNSGDPVPIASLDNTSEEWASFLAVQFEGVEGDLSAQIAKADEYLRDYPIKAPAMDGAAPAGIDKWDDEIDGKFTDLANGKLADTLKLIANIHEREKASVLRAGRAIDGYKNRLTTDLEAKRNALKTSMTIYKKWLNDEALRVQREEAAKAQAEANRIAVEAARTMEPEALAKAEEAYAEADAAEKAVQAPAATRTRTHGQFGAVSSLRDNWTWEVEDESAGLMRLVQAVAAGKAPLAYLAPNGPRLTLAVRTEKVRGGIPGIRIYNDQKA